MTRTLNINAGIMLLLSTALTYLTLGIHTPDVSAAYSLGEIVGQAIAATLLPLLLVSIPAGIFKYRKKTQPAGFLYLALVILDYIQCDVGFR